jgi:hypothetical protein
MKLCLSNQEPTGFSKAEILIFIPKGPSSGITFMVYPDEKERQVGFEIRDEFKIQ